MLCTVDVTARCCYSTLLWLTVNNRNNDRAVPTDSLEFFHIKIVVIIASGELSPCAKKNYADLTVSKESETKYYNSGGK